MNDICGIRITPLRGLRGVASQIARVLPIVQIMGRCPPINFMGRCPMLMISRLSALRWDCELSFFYITFEHEIFYSEKTKNNNSQPHLKAESHEIISMGQRPMI